MSNSGSMRRPEIRKFLANRRSSCWILASNCVIGGIRSTVTVPFAPADKLRPSDGAMSAFLNTALA